MQCVLSCDMRKPRKRRIIRLLYHTFPVSLGPSMTVKKGGVRSSNLRIRQLQARSALQTLHKASAIARSFNYFAGGLTHSWIEYYEKKISSDRSCVNEWNAMDDLESRRPASPDSVRSRPREREKTEQIIRVKLKEIMMTVDLDEVTSKVIRTKLEDEMNMNLQDYKSFIDEEMITILGQMDAPSQVFDYLYLGTEWNASNFDELNKIGIRYILNVTREIDNFFPGVFNYQNIRVYDDESTELLKHWDCTYKFISNAKDEGSKVLVHCKMGVSRSASVVIAYAMKAYNWNLDQALTFVKSKRNCINPNKGFMKQLEIYQGILDASKQRHNFLWRSKSETSLKFQQSELSSPSDTTATDSAQQHRHLEAVAHYMESPSAHHRPKSWSPDDNTADALLQENSCIAGTLDNKNINMHENSFEALNSREQSMRNRSSSDPSVAKNHVLMPCNGQTYSVSQNKAFFLPVTATNLDVEITPVRFQIGDEDFCQDSAESRLISEGVCTDDFSKSNSTIRHVSSVKNLISELESHTYGAELKLSREPLDLPDMTGLVQNLASQFEGGSQSNPSSPPEEVCCENPSALFNFKDQEQEECMLENIEPILSQTKLPATRHQAILVRPEMWAEEEDAGAEEKLLRDLNNKLVNSGEVEQAGPGPPPLDRDCIIQNTTTTTTTTTTNQQQSEKNCVNNKNSMKCKDDIASEEILPVTDSNPVEGLPRSSVVDKVQGTNVKSSCVESSNVKMQSTKGEREEPRKNSSSHLPAMKLNDPFSAHLDKVFEHEEQAQDVQPIDIPTRHDSWESGDSAIGMRMPDQRESPSRQSSWSSVDSYGTVFLSRESSWGASDAHKCARQNEDVTVSCARACIPVSMLKEIVLVHEQGDVIGIGGTGSLESGTRLDDKTLKRTSSFDDCRTYNYSCGDSVSGNLNEDVNGCTDYFCIQRSSSLRGEPRRQSSSYSSGSPEFSTNNKNTINFRLHTPVPYRSPSEKSPPLTALSNSTQDPALSKPPAQNHYASTPILSHSNGFDIVQSTEPMHSASHPNISFNQPVMMVSKAHLKLELGNNILNLCDSSAENYSGEINCAKSLSPTHSEVPYPGIVKLQKEVLQNKIASSTQPSNNNNNNIATTNNNNSSLSAVTTAATSTLEIVKSDRKNSVKEEIKKALPSSSSTQSTSSGTVLLDNRKSVGSPDQEENSCSVVRRITKEIEAKGSNGSYSNGSQQQQQKKMIIVDQYGKEQLTPPPSNQPPPSFPSLPSPPTNQPEYGTNVCSSPLEDKSVKSLVEKFQVKEPASLSASAISINPRTRYHSENEIVSSDFQSTSPLSTYLSSSTLPHRKFSLDNECPTKHQQYSAKAVVINSNASSTGQYCASDPPITLEESSADRVNIPICTLNTAAATTVKTPIVTPSVRTQNIKNESSGANGGLINHTLSASHQGPRRNINCETPVILNQSSAASANKPPLNSKLATDATITPGATSTLRKTRVLHGKSHPLTKLAPKQRHTNPVYNTM